MAYRLDGDDEANVLRRLDERERGGYERIEKELYFDDCSTASSRRGWVYLATPANPNYLGPASLEEMGRQVRASSGPSGENVEYVLRLAEALRKICPALEAESEEVLALAEWLREEP